MKLIRTLRSPAFRMGLRRSVRVWRHVTPPYPALPPLDLGGVFLPFPRQPSPFDRDGEWLDPNEFDRRVQSWGREVERVNRENELRAAVWCRGLHVGIGLIVSAHVLAFALMGIVVFCLVR